MTEPHDSPPHDAPAAAPTRAVASYLVPLAIVTSLFFMWGGITSLNDVLIPHLKALFDLTYAKGMLVQTAFFSGYFLFAWPAGRLTDGVGYRWAMVVGLGVMAAGTAAFIPAAAVPSYPLFLGALMILAAGMTVLQVAANPYVAALGPPRTASSRLNLTQAFNSLGTTVFPFVGGLLILGGATAEPAARRAMSAAQLRAYQVGQAHSVRMPYLVLSAALFVLAALFAIARLPDVSPGEDEKATGPTGGRRESLWSHRNFVLAAIGVFAYVGAEVAVGSFLINYLSAPVAGGGIVGLTEAAAAKYVALYWGGAMVGRFVGSAVLQRVDGAVLLGLFAAAAFALVATSMLTTGHLAMVAILAVGLFNSIMFPNLFAIGLAGLGGLTGKASSVMVAAIVGGAIIPFAQGLIADRIGVHHAFVLPLLCYAYIGFVAVDQWRSGRATTLGTARGFDVVPQAPDRNGNRPG